jgi:outer membrane lipoprotein carrier protein
VSLRVIGWGLILLASTAPAWCQSAIEGVENRYNRLKTLKVEFEESVSYGGRPRRQERGILYLQRPGRMRWDYTAPPGKLFLADGKMFYLYNPNSNQVQQIKPREAADFRAPLAFLLGNLDLRKEFGPRILLRTTSEGLEMTCQPRSEDEAFSQVVFTLDPQTYSIRRIVIAGADGSTTEFRFRGEELNPRLESRLFVFQAPPGAEILEAGAR